MTEPALPPSPSTPRASPHQITVTEPNGATAPVAASKPPQRGPPPGEKKVLTKAERREIQERQRAEKEALKSQGGSKGGGGGASAAPKPKSQPKQQQQQPPASGTPSTPARQRGAPRSGGGDTPAVPRMARRGSIVAPSDLAPIETLRIFSHFGLPKPLSSLGEGIRGEIHPVIRKLGLQFADFRIVGANARCIATLTAFKTVIQDYITPRGTTLSRHLMTYLSPQISFLTAARPMSVSTGNAIRYLKYEISILSIDLPEQDAKNFMCERIDTFIHERITVADQVIQSLTMEKIYDGDTVLVYARSSVVEKALLAAKAAGRNFNVVAIDSRPLSEGKRLLASLTSASIPTTYALLPSLPTILPTVSTVMLGAHAVHANGSLYSRSGTAMVAMMAKAQGVPVIVCCETYKFSDAVLLDSFMKNELAPDSMCDPGTEPLSILQRGLQVESLLYDLTPHTNLTALVTEVGLIPATAVPTVLARGIQRSM
ncbi:hypothetical protein FRB94_010226 [Tulasnella sp. JGI-2019a]|nr:hypothetical protein FRB93_009319 [Tulasnella sp. JGI-2019a]KAG8993968.1 hypothetical protein FRB94_010226 [Tulasnella sp. JGI-2019a]